MEKVKKEVVAQGADASKDNVRELGKNVPAVIVPALNLPQTIKTVEELYKKIRHRDRLELYTDQLRDFVLAKTDEDLDATGYYNGCHFEIKDDNNNKFILKHPGIIKEIIGFVSGRFTARLKEIEAEIKLPINTAA